MRNEVSVLVLRFLIALLSLALACNLSLLNNRNLAYLGIASLVIYVIQFYEIMIIVGIIKVQKLKR